jgi:hypothetical protein
MVWLTEIIQEIMNIALEGCRCSRLHYPAYVLVRVQHASARLVKRGRLC